MQGESPLQMAERHVRDAEAHVTRQMELIEKLHLDHHYKLEADAETLLRVFQDTLKTYQQDLARLRAATTLG